MEALQCGHWTSTDSVEEISSLLVDMMNLPIRTFLSPCLCVNGRRSHRRPSRIHLFLVPYQFDPHQIVNKVHQSTSSSMIDETFSIQALNSLG
jgi:hypothetical protein